MRLNAGNELYAHIFYIKSKQVGFHKLYELYTHIFYINHFMRFI